MADKLGKQRKFHKWMNEMTVRETLGYDDKPIVLTNYGSEQPYGPTEGLVALRDKKGRLCYVPVEWLEKEKPPEDPWEYAALSTVGHGYDFIGEGYSAEKVKEYLKNNRYWVAVKRRKSGGYTHSSNWEIL